MVSGLRSDGKVTLLSDLGRFPGSAPLAWAVRARQAKELRILWRSASSMTDFLALSPTEEAGWEKEGTDLKHAKRRVKTKE